ncbi:tyrosine-type recombinase/integrase [Bradyrhizobium sp. 6(2017)]|uniref:tyrosine-type recombinase/integrase n=1 Tax=Bradyrhizobium sp. 6(2017) TaxID=1197460 RepID=UPI0013E1B925|nr:tyrosine-type recombinase/integrase [Bradyrhizobium sp. 6(2017)]QIG93430.1 tyrosine-type recombinase/integrase [Bradyrhizobium sp. 6(2017)]
MTTITTTTKRSSVVLTDRICQRHVTERTKVYDRKCPGLYASILPAGTATFNFKFTDKQTGKQRSTVLGVYNPETFTVDDARSKVYALKAMTPAALVAQLRQTKVVKIARGKTVAEIVEERITWMGAKVLKRDGEMRPRIESWEGVTRHLRNFVVPRLGKMIASEVTKHHIATLSNDIVAGKHGGKASVANARHMRRAASGLFNWAAEAGRDYVSASPCINLPKLDEEHPRTRVLSADEIRVFWHGLGRTDLPWDRTTRLALKFALVTMLRSGELLPIHRDEINTSEGTVDIPANRVKKRRIINQPLSDLALEIIREAMGNYDYAFTGRFGNAPLARQAMSGALKGTKHKNGKVKTPGICDLLGLKPFTTHDLRRTAATMCGELGLSEAGISLCLDHQANKDEHGKPLPAVTNRVYNLATRNRVLRKREVLDPWAAELRRIIGAADAEMRMAA